ncbi:MAG TPA: hypothetical protein VHJ19_01470, partial [Gammaproteobacteria bacterium]|nr:hypothetical protein [Gammaproteobacteria bacterium]
DRNCSRSLIQKASGARKGCVPVRIIEGRDHNILARARRMYELSMANVDPDVMLHPAGGEE